MIRRCFETGKMLRSSSGNGEEVDEDFDTVITAGSLRRCVSFG